MVLNKNVDLVLWGWPRVVGNAFVSLVDTCSVVGCIQVSLEIATYQDTT